MSISPKVLVARMTPTARQMLEAAVGHSASATHYEVTIEHVLGQMVGPEEGDVGAIYRHFGVSRGPLEKRVARIIECMPKGNGGRPVFTGKLWQWVQDAWTYGSLEYGAQMIRTGHLFYALVQQPGRYISETIPELEDFALESLKLELPSALELAREQIESMGAPALPRPSPPADAAEEAVARVALRRRAKLEPLLAALRMVRLAAEAQQRPSLFAELLVAALEGENDPLSSDAVTRAARAASEALAVLARPRSPSARAPSAAPGDNVLSIAQWKSDRAAIAPTHYFRVQIMSFSGSVSMRLSGLFGTIGELSNALATELSDRENLSYLLDGDVTLELFVDCQRVFVTDLRPAIAVMLDGRPFALQLDAEEPEAAHEEIFAAHQIRTAIDLSALHIPTPHGAPLRPGTETRLSIEGVTRHHSYGWVLVWNNEWDSATHAE